MGDGFDGGHEQTHGQTQGNTQDARRPEVDLAQVQFLLDIYVSCGAMTAEQAREMLTHAPGQAVNGAMVCRDTGTPDAPQVFDPENERNADEEIVPQGVHMGQHRSSRAQMLDWDTRHNTLTPETADGTDGDSTMREMFEAHRREQIVAVFGEGANMDFVRTAIEVANNLGRSDVASHVEASLFRANQYAMVESLNVEDSSRYAPGGGSTYCNIYAHDLVSGLGGYFPRTWWYDAIVTRIQDGAEVVSTAEYNRRRDAGESVTDLIRPVYGETIREMNANSLTAWMSQWGGEFGWTAAADAQAAQDAANSGEVVIVLAANSNARRSGHVTVVLAEDSEHQAPRDDDNNVVAPLQSQAGSSNFNYSSDETDTRQRSRWWENASHTNGGFWIFRGATRSPIVTPETLGAAR